MNDDYLWDGSGQPDPEIQKLETTLSRFRCKSGRAPDFSERVHTRVLPQFLGARFFPKLIAATVAIAIAASVWVAWRRSVRVASETPQAGWSVASLGGAPHVGNKAIGAAGERDKLMVGQTLETDSHSRASITVEEMGQVEIDPDTRVRVLGSASASRRLALDRGTIHATIWAPPGEFMVDTPSAIAVDLGCAYTLHVDDSGAGLLRTTLGWVGFQFDGHESFIPAGAICATRPQIGPGTPCYEDAPEQFRDALTQLDFGAGTADQREAELSTVLAETRRRDAFTLWHLLSRVEPSDRGRVYDRLAALVPPPPQVTREGVLRLDRQMLDLWWSEFGLGDISLWRTWERSWVKHDSKENLQTK